MTRRRVSGLVVPLEAALPLAEPWRHLLPANVRELPPYVPVLWPFLAAEHVDAGVEARLAALFAACRPFDVRLATHGSFPDAFYLVPEPADPFEELTRLVWQEWPECPPYGGAFDEAAPRLTLALDPDAAALADLAATVTPQLPLAARAERVLLFEEAADGVYQLRRWFGLGRT